MLIQITGKQDYKLMAVKQGISSNVFTYCIALHADLLNTYSSLLLIWICRSLALFHWFSPSVPSCHPKSSTATELFVITVITVLHTLREETFVSWEKREIFVVGFCESAEMGNLTGAHFG